MSERVEERLGNYRLNQLLGTGAFADIYLSTHIYLNSHVAIKVLRGPFDAHALDSFLTEARLLINLVHPHIIRIIDFGIEGDTPYLVMDYAPGGNLRQLYPPGSVVPLSTVGAYVSALASALQYSHSHHLIHRDLKPENLLLGPTHELLLSDIGLALLFADGDPFQVQERFGTLEYMAPELIRGHPLPASDQYALAVMVYEWLSGQRPFGGTKAEVINQHLYTPPASLREQHPELAPALEQVLFKALSKEPALRYVDVLSFASAFAEASHPSARLPWAPGGAAALLVQGEQLCYANLPRPRMPLLGREQELAAARNLLLRPEVQLLTLIGAPGVGKTRLALALGADVWEAYTHGVCFVSLAPLSDPDLVGPTIAHTLGLPEYRNRSLVDQLKTFLRDKELLLLLDNFEQVLKASSLLAELLWACPRLKILVTSRAVLHLEGEQEFPVPPLAVPDLQHLPAQELLAQVPAVALFVQRAQAVQPWFALTAENAASIADLCVRLEGVPLAIVLAAARVKVLSPQALLVRLQDRFEVLTGSRQDAPAHQQTLRATIAWSYNLLSSEEQTIFRRLCVFVGGFTLEAAEAVCTSGAESTTPALEVISSLVDHSLLLLREQEGGERRLLLLEMIREYGLERLIAAGELERARDAHAAYYLALAERAEPALRSAEQARWGEQLKRDYENIRAAILWLLERHAIEVALRLATALQQFWVLHGYHSEGRRFLAQALEAASAQQDSSLSQVRARALYTASFLAFLRNDPGQATVLLEESERLSRRVQDKRGIALALGYLGVITHNRGEVQPARAMHEEALRLSREVGVNGDLAEILFLVGAIALFHGAYAQARELFEESLAVFKVLGDVWRTAVVLHYVGWLAYEQRAYAHARELTEESLAQVRT